MNPDFLNVYSSNWGKRYKSVCVNCGGTEEGHLSECDESHIGIFQAYRKNPPEGWEDEFVTVNVYLLNKTIYSTPATKPACECGAHKLGIRDRSPGHSSWCKVSV